MKNNKPKFELEDKECRVCGTYESGFGQGCSMDFSISYHRCKKCGYTWETKNRHRK